MGAPDMVVVPRVLWERAESIISTRDADDRTGEVEDFMAKLEDWRNDGPLLRWGELVDLKDTTHQVWKTRVTVLDAENGGSVKVHITFREDDEGNLREVFVAAGSKGSTPRFLCDSLSKAWSRQLRLGLPLYRLVDDLIGQHGPLRGDTRHPLLRRVLGVEDLVGKLMGYHYLGRRDFVDDRIYQAFRESLDYESPRYEHLEHLREFRSQAAARKEVRLDGFDEDDTTPHV